MRNTYAILHKSISISGSQNTIELNPITHERNNPNVQESLHQE
jgi:hypothetical protein